jgi:uncharacterized membrane-anchored protein YhcB (DUF1043 family)
MSILEVSQIIFNFAASTVIIIVGLLIGVIAFEIIKSINRAKKIAQEIKVQSAEFYRRVDGFLSAFATMPFLSKIFTKHKKNHEK